PYSGSLDSSNIPVVCWCLASCSGGTGTVTFRDQSNAIVATMSPVGSQAWYYAYGNLTDGTVGTQTSKVDVFFAGDGSNACKIIACGMFMHATDDPFLANSNVASFGPKTNFNPRLMTRRPVRGTVAKPL